MSHHIQQVVAVIVTYQPELDLLYKNYQALAAQVAEVIIVDNSDNSHAREGVFRLFAAYPDVYYFNNQGNQGIAQALNQGVQIAKDRGADWMLSMDQDSVLPPGYVATLCRSLADCDEKVVSIGTPFTSGNRLVSETIAGGEVKLLITSANLIQLDAIQKIGGFRDDLFIDYVDIDLSFRLRKAGYRLMETHAIVFAHHLGNPVRRSFLGKSFIYTNHSALRCYYISRNRMVFFRENLFFDVRFVFRCVGHMVKEFIKILIAEEQKKSKIMAILTGIRDGLAGRMGKFQGKF